MTEQDLITQAKIDNEQIKMDNERKKVIEINRVYTRRRIEHYEEIKRVNNELTL